MKRMTWILATGLALGMAWQVSATEGLGAYPNGAEGLMTGALPPPGQYLVNYTMYYQADTFRDQDNHNAFDFHARALADIVRLVNVTPITVLGGNWAQHIFVPLMHEDVQSDTRGVHQHTTGVGDVIVDPFIVGWHKPPFHWIVGMDTFVPVGKYSKNDADNLGNHYWTFEPLAAVTYLNEAGYELSAKFMYDFNTCNTCSPQGNYTSGQEFHTDFVAAKHFGPWAAGVGGYYYQQTTDDQINNVQQSQSRGRTVALGPQFSYQYKSLNFSFAFDREFAVENRPQGDKVWLKLVVPL